jgi:hypothetical protein
VHTTARARQDGALGDLVRVESLDTKEPFEVRITGPREAAVFVPSAAYQPGRSPAETARRLAPAEEIVPFKNLAPVARIQRGASERPVTAFRNYSENGGPSNGEIR